MSTYSDAQATSQDAVEQLVVNMIYQSRAEVMEVFLPEYWARWYAPLETRDALYPSMTMAAFEAAQEGFMFSDEVLQFWNDLFADNSVVLLPNSDETLRAALALMNSRRTLYETYPTRELALD